MPVIKFRPQRESRPRRRRNLTLVYVGETGTQGKASGVQGTAMSPLIARVIGRHQHTPLEGKTNQQALAC